MSEEREQRLRAALAQLKQEHRDLDAAIAGLEQTVRADAAADQAPEEEEIALKDQIARVEDELFPDIIA